jgi:hypothetical protein
MMLKKVDVLPGEGQPRHYVSSWGAWIGRET